MHSKGLSQGYSFVPVALALVLLPLDTALNVVCVLCPQLLELFSVFSCSFSASHSLTDIRAVQWNISCTKNKSSGLPLTRMLYGKRHKYVKIPYSAYCVRPIHYLTALWHNG